MRINWLGTAAIALILGTGSALAQQSDLQRRDEGGARSSLPSKGAERPAAREERPAGTSGGMNDRSAQREGGTMEPRRSEGPSSREQAQDQPSRDRQPTRQSQDQIGRDHSTVGEGQSRPDERMSRDREQAAGQKDQQKQDRHALDSGKAGESKQQQSQDQRRSGQTTGTAQQNLKEPQKGREAEGTTRQKGRDTDRAAEQKGTDANRAAEQKQLPGGDRNNQAAQPPSSTETQAGRQPQNPSQTTGQAQQRDTTGQNQQTQSAGQAQTTSSVKVSDQQRTQVIDRLRRDRDIDQARTNINIHVNVGERLPERVRPRPLPADIVSIAPEYRGYEYTVIEDQVTIVDPRSREVVDIIPERGFTADSGSYHSRTRISLSTEQRESLRREALSAGSTTVGSTAGGGGSGQTCLSLRPVPQDLARDNPDLASYSYVAIGDQIVLVDPRDRRIVDVIDQDNR